MQKRILYIIITVLFIPIYSYSQNNETYEFLNSFGVKASNISGYGFYYNRELSVDHQIQVMGLLYYYYSKEEDREHGIFNYDIGLEWQFNVIRSKYSRFYVLVGAYYYFDDDENLRSSITLKRIVNNSYNAGVGAAWELNYKRFILSLDLGYKFFEDNKEITEVGIEPYADRIRLTKVGAGIGVGFQF